MILTLWSSVGADHDDDFSGIRSFSSSWSGPGGFQQQQQQQHHHHQGGMPGGFFGMPGFGGFGGMPGMQGMQPGVGAGAGFGRKEPPVVREIGLTLVRCTESY